MNKTEKLFTLDFYLVSIIGLLVRLAMFIKMTLQPLYLLDLFSSKTIAGAAMTVFTLSSIVLRPFSGRIIDKYGRKSIFTIGTLLFAVTTIPFGFVYNLPALFIFQALCGVGFSFQSVSSTTMVTDIVPQKRLVEGLGYYGLTATLAQAAGPAAALMLIDKTGYSPGFVIVGIIAAAAVIAAVFIRYESRPLTSACKTLDACKEPGEKTVRFISRIIEPKAAYASLFMGILALLSAAVSTFLVPYAKLVGIESIALYFTVRAAGVGFSRLFAGKVSKRFSEYTVLAAGLFAVFAGTLGILFVRSVYFLIPVALIYGLGYGFSSLLLNVGAVVKTTKKERAAANATFYLAMDAGIVSAPLPGVLLVIFSVSEMSSPGQPWWRFWHVFAI